MNATLMPRRLSVRGSGSAFSEEKRRKNERVAKKERLLRLCFLFFATNVYSSIVCAKEKATRGYLTRPMRDYFSDPKISILIRMEHIGQAHRGHDPSTPLGIDKHAGHYTEDFLKKFWVTLALTVPIILYSDLPELFLAWRAPVFPGSEYLALVLGTMVFFYGGLVFLRGAVAELKARLPGMMTLIALAITAAYLYSVGAVLLGTGMTLFWELSTLIAVMLLGHFIEMKAVRSAKGALRELAKLLPEAAEVIRDGKTIFLSLADLRQGDIALVRPGGRGPADGLVG